MPTAYLGMLLVDLQVFLGPDPELCLRQSHQARGLAVLPPFGGEGVVRLLSAMHLMFSLHGM